MDKDFSKKIISSLVGGGMSDTTIEVDFTELYIEYLENLARDRGDQIQQLEAKIDRLESGKWASI